MSNQVIVDLFVEDRAHESFLEPLWNTNNTIREGSIRFRFLPLFFAREDRIK